MKNMGKPAPTGKAKTFSVPEANDFS